MKAPVRSGRGADRPALRGPGRAGEGEDEDERERWGKRTRFPRRRERRAAARGGRGEEEKRGRAKGGGRVLGAGRKEGMEGGGLEERMKKGWMDWGRRWPGPARISGSW